MGKRNNTAADSAAAEGSPAPATPCAQIPPEQLPDTGARLRLHFLDGLRGLAALYVVLFHFTESRYLVDASGTRLPLPPLLQATTAWLHYGHYAVAVFIVLSGYSLMLPLARAGDVRLRSGWRPYLLRRARRILPPYYAALLLSLFSFAIMRRLSDVSPGALGSHLLLLHNLNPDWNTAINTPLWSVATEWHIYFLFPLVLLPLWRRGGALAAVAGAFTLGLLPHFLLPRAYNFDWACPWYLGLFTLGMTAATIHFAPAPGTTWLRNLPWAGLTLVLFMAFIVLAAARPLLLTQGGWLLDLLAGVAAMCLVCACASATLRTPGKNALLKVVEHPWALGLGTFSYSLYLTHILVKAALYALAGSRNLSPAALQIVLLAAGVPISLAVGWIFYQCVERYFLTLRPPFSKTVSPARRETARPAIEMLEVSSTELEKIELDADKPCEVA